MALQSALLRGDPKLEAAATSDACHIAPGARGPHVTKIQQALIQVAGAKIQADGIYGVYTARAVAEYKKNHRPQILNYAGIIDDIVGIKTLAFLDAELPRQGGGPQLNFVIVATTMDVVVNLIGAPAPRPDVPEEAIPFTMLSPSYAREASSPDGRLLRHKTNGNLLLRIAHRTTDFGPKGIPTLKAVRQRVSDAFISTDPANVFVEGKIFILGSSSGGRCVLDLAAMFLNDNITPALIAPIDASFAQSDTDSRPPDNPQTVLPPPSFQVARICAGGALLANIKERHNWFQNQGNHRGDSLNPFAAPFYTSGMKNGEIHGTIVGFTNHPMFISGAGTMSDDQIHDLADPTGRREAQLMIAKALA